jgi:hypothetical protein
MTDTPPIIIEYANMTDEQRRIVGAGQMIEGLFRSGLTREEPSAWIRERFGV